MKQEVKEYQLWWDAAMLRAGNYNVVCWHCQQVVKTEDITHECPDYNN